MGGSSGGWNKPPRTREVARRVAAETARSSAAAGYATQVNACLSDELKGCNDRNIDAVKTHLATLEGAISKDVEAGELNLLFGGSVRKHTFVDGLSDVDVLAIVSDSSLAGLSAGELLDAFTARIRTRLPLTEVKAGALAVSVKFSDGIEIQLLPAQRTATGIRIKVPGDDEWSNVVRPDRFARKLTEVNQSCGCNVVPVVKLFKSLQGNFPKANRLSGYHVESLAIEAFRSYDGARSLKDMFVHFCAQVAERVRTPIRETTGQSRHVDDKLGDANSSDRVRIATAVGRVLQRLRDADAAGDAEVWKREFNGE